MKAVFYQTSDVVWRVAGDKAAVFLHGQFSNSIKDLAVGHLNYNLLLTLKGKTVADAFVLHRSDAFALVVADRFSLILRQSLSRIAALSRVTITDHEPRIKIYHVLAGEASLVSQTQNFPVPHPGEFIMNDLPEGILCVAGCERLGENGVDIWILDDAVSLRSFTALCAQADWHELAATEIEKRRIQNGRALIGVDATESELPQEVGLTQALHFNKGCYLGQEVMARLQFRGHVNRRLVRLKCDAANVQMGAPVLVGAEEIGRLTSVSADTLHGGSLALALLPIKIIDSGEVLSVDNQPAHVI